jgi:hypothetical protein
MKKVYNSLLALALLVSGLSFTSCEESEKVEELKGELVLSASSSLIIADGDAELVLTAIIGDVDVTSEVELYVNNAIMSSNVFTTDVPGTYKFYANYKGQISNKVIINAANPALYVKLPEDSLASKFSDFQRKVLLTEATGTWCGYCPYMIAALELFCESGSNADKTVIVATHSGDEFSSTASEAAIGYLKADGFPSCYVNLNADALIKNNYADVNAEIINSMVGIELKEAASVGISTATAVSVDSTIVGVRAGVKVGKEGKYRINAWLVEDGVEAYQSGAEAVISHMHILRGASCTSPILGELLGGKEVCSNGDTLEYYYEFDAKKEGVVNLANCKVVVMVATTSDISSSKFFVNNVVECCVGESLPFAYN